MKDKDREFDIDEYLISPEKLCKIVDEVSNGFERERMKKEWNENQLLRGTDIGLLLFTVLGGIPEIEGRIYPVIAENGSAMPFVVYERQFLNPVYNKEGIIEDAVGINLTAVSADYAQSVRIADYIRDVLDEFKYVLVYDCRLTGSSESYEDSLGFLQHLSYTFHVQLK
jgi:hypothetical protein